MVDNTHLIFAHAGRRALLLVVVDTYLTVAHAGRRVLLGPTREPGYAAKHIAGLLGP